MKESLERGNERDRGNDLSMEERRKEVDGKGGRKSKEKEKGKRQLKYYI